MENNNLGLYRTEFKAVQDNRQLIEYSFYAEDIHKAYTEASNFSARQDEEYVLKYLIRVWS
tara:strand:+ start:533 stop:715 length:183 start_codon:yes stop_codon:yes gene_type:complete